MTAPPKPGPHLTVDRIDQAITKRYADLTFRSPEARTRIWDAIDSLLDQRNKLTGHT